MKKLAVLLALLLAALAGIWGANYALLGRKLTDVMLKDPRNSGVVASAHFRHYVEPAVLVFDLEQIGGQKSMSDVFRVFLQLAEQLKASSFERVELAHQGQVKFYLRGDYFQRLGLEYQSQNPVYTIRTFPENVYKPDGTHAFETWTGGMLGVLGKQMSDANEFHRQWYLNDLQRTP